MPPQGFDDGLAAQDAVAAERERFVEEHDSRAIGHGRIEAEQPGAFAFVALDRAVEPFELGGDDLVLVGWRAGDHGALGGDQLPRVEQRLADLREDVFVELVGADVALRAATHA